MKFNTVNDCLKEDPVATKTKNWGSYCKTIAWIAFIILEIIVIIVSSALSTGLLVYELAGKGFILFLIGSVISFLNVAPMFIFGTILTAMAQIVQNTAVSANATMYLISNNTASGSIRSNKNSQPEDAAEYSAEEGAYLIQQEIFAPKSTLSVPTIAWKCPRCGEENRAYFNVCTNCGAIVKVAPQSNT